MESFRYFTVSTVKEACTLLAQYGEDAKVLGGGQSLVNLLKQNLISPKYIINIKDVSDLNYIRFDKTDGLRIGALATHRSLETSSVVREQFPILMEMEHTLASLPVRNWGTVGGNLAHADPASDLAPTLMALGANVTLAGATGERVVSMDDFFIDYFETAIQADELLTEIHIPNAGKGTGCFYKFAQRKTDLAVVSAATYLIVSSKDRNLLKEIRIVMGSVGPTPLRSKNAEDLLKGKPITETLIEEAAGISANEAQPVTDINGSEQFKREIIKVIVKRVVKEALSRGLRVRAKIT